MEPTTSRLNVSLHCAGAVPVEVMVLDHGTPGEPRVLAHLTVGDMYRQDITVVAEPDRLVEALLKAADLITARAEALKVSRVTPALEGV